MDKKDIDLLNKHFPLKIIGEKGFWLKATPIWFQLIGWILTIGAIKAIHDLTDSLGLRIILAISYVALAFYIQDYFYNLNFDIPFIKTARNKRAVSIFLSFLIILSIWIFISSVIENLNLKNI